MKLGEIAGTGVWIASAVKVAGYTWQSYTGSYNKFPSPTGSVGSGISVPGLLSSIPVVGPVLGFAAKGWSDIGKLVSGG